MVQGFVCFGREALCGNDVRYAPPWALALSGPSETEWGGALSCASSPLFRKRTRDESFCKVEWGHSTGRRDRSALRGPISDQLPL